MHVSRLPLYLLISLAVRETVWAEQPVFTFNPGGRVSVHIREKKTTSHMSESTALFSVGSEAVASLSIVRTDHGYRVTDSLLDFSMSFGSDGPPTRVREALETSAVILELDSTGLAREIADADSSLSRLDSTIGPGWTSLMQKARGNGGEKSRRARQWNRWLRPLLGNPVRTGACYFNQGEYPCLTGELFRFFDFIQIVDTSTGPEGILVATLVMHSHTRPGDLVGAAGLEASVVADAFDLTPEEWESLDTASSVAHVRTERRTEVKSLLPISERAEAKVTARRIDIGGDEVTVQLAEVSELIFEYQPDSGSSKAK